MRAHGRLAVARMIRIYRRAAAPYVGSNVFGELPRNWSHRRCCTLAYWPPPFSWIGGRLSTEVRHAHERNGNSVSKSLQCEIKARLGRSSTNALIQIFTDALFSHICRNMF